MASIFGSELRARFGGYRPSRIDHARAVRAREGNCLCGVPVAAHFDDDNVKVSCENARAKFEARIETPRAIANPPLETCDVCLNQIPATQTTKTLANGTLLCSERCELDFYDMRRHRESRRTMKDTIDGINEQAWDKAMQKPIDTLTHARAERASRWPLAACGLSGRFLDLTFSDAPTCPVCIEKAEHEAR